MSAAIEVAIEAAAEVLKTPDPPYRSKGILSWEQIARIAIGAAAPHLLAPVAKLADEWHEQGEELMAESRAIQDEYISVELLKQGASMVENARYLRNAIKGAS